MRYTPGGDETGKRGMGVLLEREHALEKERGGERNSTLHNERCQGKSLKSSQRKLTQYIQRKKDSNNSSFLFRNKASQNTVIQHL